MKLTNNKLTLLQFIFIIHGVQLGVGLITLPREAAEGAGTDGWISIFLCGLITTFASIVIVQVMNKYPNGTILDLISHYFGKWIGKLFTLLFFLYFTIMTSVTLVRETLFIQSWILPFSQLYVLYILLAIPTYLIVSEDIHIIGRYAVVVFIMSAWLIIIYFMPLQFANWLHLLPIIKDGWSPIITTVKKAIFAYSGFEVAFFLYPYLQNKKQATIGVIIANVLTTGVFVIVTLIVYAFYNPYEVINYSEPAMTMLKVIELKFIERLEIIFFSFYLFIISTTVIPYMFFAIFCLRNLMNKGSQNTLTLSFLLIVFLYVYFYKPTFENNLMVQQIVDQFGLIIAYILPIILWIVLIFISSVNKGSRRL